MIEQLGIAFAAIRKRILQRENSDDVREALAQTAGQAGLDIDLLRRFDLDTVRLFAMPTGELEPTRCWLMAEILYLDGLEASLSDEAAVESLLKARALFDLVRPAGGLLVGWPEAAARIAEIDTLLEQAPDGRSRRVRAIPRPGAGRRSLTSVTVV
jgi:hypothetical protein